MPNFIIGSESSIGCACRHTTASRSPSRAFAWRYSSADVIAEQVHACTPSKLGM